MRRDALGVHGCEVSWLECLRDTQVRGPGTAHDEGEVFGLGLC